MEYLLLKRTDSCSLAKDKSKNYIKDKKPFQEYNDLMQKYKKDYKDFDEKDKKRINKLLTSFPSKTAIHLLSVNKEDTVRITLEDLKGKVTITDYDTPKKRKKDRYKILCQLTQEKIYIYHYYKKIHV